MPPKRKGALGLVKPTQAPTVPPESRQAIALYAAVREE